MMAPRIWIRGVGRTRAPSLYQFTAMPGRVLMSQRSFRTLPGSNRRCSVVSSLKSSRTSAKSRHGISLQCWRLFSSFYDQSEHPFRALLLLLFISFVALIISPEPSLIAIPSVMTFSSSNSIISSPHIHTSTMTLPWRQGLTDPSHLHSPFPSSSFCSPVNCCETESDLASSANSLKKKQRKETRRKGDWSWWTCRNVTAVAEWI